MTPVPPRACEAWRLLVVAWSALRQALTLLTLEQLQECRDELVAEWRRDRCRNRMRQLDAVAAELKAPDG